MDRFETVFGATAGCRQKQQGCAVDIPRSQLLHESIEPKLASTDLSRETARARTMVYASDKGNVRVRARRGNHSGTTRAGHSTATQNGNMYLFIQYVVHLVSRNAFQEKTTHPLIRGKRFWSHAVLSPGVWAVSSVNLRVLDLRTIQCFEHMQLRTILWHPVDDGGTLEVWYIACVES